MERNYFPQHQFLPIMKNLCFSSINKEQLLPFQTPASENIIVFCAFAGSVATLSAWKSALFEKISLSERSEFEIFSNGFS